MMLKNLKSTSQSSKPFAVGQTVRCLTSGGNNLSVGKLYKVAAYDAASDLVSVIPLDGAARPIGPVYSTRFTAEVQPQSIPESAQPIPTFLEAFCEAVSEEFNKDSIQPCIVISRVKSTKGPFYVAIHRYPDGVYSKRVIVANGYGESVEAATKALAKDFAGEKKTAKDRLREML